MKKFNYEILLIIIGAFMTTVFYMEKIFNNRKPNTNPGSRKLNGPPPRYGVNFLMGIF